MAEFGDFQPGQLQQLQQMFDPQNFERSVAKLQDPTVVAGLAKQLAQSGIPAPDSQSLLAFEAQNAGQGGDATVGSGEPSPTGIGALPTPQFPNTVANQVQRAVNPSGGVAGTNLVGEGPPQEGPSALDLFQIPGAFPGQEAAAAQQQKVLNAQEATTSAEQLERFRANEGRTSAFVPQTPSPPLTPGFEGEIGGFGGSPFVAQAPSQGGSPSSPTQTLTPNILKKISVLPPEIQMFLFEGEPRGGF